MKWEPDGKYAIRSGEWRVTKNWTAAGWLYAALRGKEVIGTAATADAAKAMCK